MGFKVMARSWWRISGDYYNVMGLPVCRLGRILAGMGVDCLNLAAARASNRS